MSVIQTAYQSSAGFPPSQDTRTIVQRWLETTLLEQELPRSSSHVMAGMIVHRLICVSLHRVAFRRDVDHAKYNNKPAL